LDPPKADEGGREEMKRKGGEGREGIGGEGGGKEGREGREEEGEEGGKRKGGEGREWKGGKTIPAKFSVLSPEITRILELSESAITKVEVSLFGKRAIPEGWALTRSQKKRIKKST
jgi:hypothetical protein